ncbi:amino acid permease, partial [Mycolicibacterium sp.]|uniref:amino acid permease n=1 Tax=Mycolicibacterium sp. TaxID=2320850 RepID=UPI003D115269
MSSTRSGPPNAYTRAQADADEAASPSGLRGEMGVIGVLMQAIAHMAPATGVAFSAAAIFAVTLVAAPVSIAIAGVIVLMLGICLTQLAKHLPSAGGYFTYVSRGVGPRAGFFTSWLYFL